MENELIESIKKDMVIELPDKIGMDEIHEKLKEHINHLIQHDFEKLVTMLYRIDVSEIKLKQLLNRDPGKDAGEIIADLIVERQLQKINTRNKFNVNNNISEEEKW